MVRCAAGREVERYLGKHFTDITYLWDGNVLGMFIQLRRFEDQLSLT